MCTENQTSILYRGGENRISSKTFQTDGHTAICNYRIALEGFKTRYPSLINPWFILIGFRLILSKINCEC